ncbi:hypothetical protein GWR56_13705 [Mucilaginibacter sp. 14171R-50]|uniref:hypothetical protein n=1 Tax=Mucilaginibacter sp. 14171R-50 TaxID=2703789 RepID=UPI00138D7F80|nr:hypothetical protein [Mucilaginibacter sp. 14171R-50]QHS56544.1 hypothetical protein GWR56_13705 [Mucilaginibacter sp. 14171R-50]
MLVDPVYDQYRFWEAPKQFLLELLFGFSKKGEDDLLLIEDFLHSTADQHAVAFPVETAHLRWHAERALDQFRDTQQAGFPITVIRQILRELSA